MQPEHELARRHDGAAAAGVGQHDDPASAHPASPSGPGPAPSAPGPSAPGPSASARASARSSSGGAPRRSHRKYSTLPLGPGRGLATTPRTPSPSSTASAATPRTASARRCGSPHDPTGAEPFPADLELWLHHHDQVGVGGGGVTVTSAGSTRRREMKDRSATTTSGTKGSVRGCQLPDVLPVQHAHPGILLQAPDQLPVADVDGHDPTRHRAAAGRR